MGQQKKTTTTRSLESEIMFFLTDFFFLGLQLMCFLRELLRDNVKHMLTQFIMVHEELRGQQMNEKNQLKGETGKQDKMREVLSRSMSP